MEYSSGLVHEFKKARPGLRQEISTDKHDIALGGGSDVPAQKPAFQLELDEVGICSKKVWVLLPQGRMGFDAKITVNLSPELRGIHMSRMEQAISELYSSRFTDLRDYAQKLASTTLSMQDGDKSRVRLKGSVPHLWQACASRHVSVDSVEITADACAAKKENNITVSTEIGLCINHITACPCTQVYTEELFGKNTSPSPMPTHSQRSSTILLVEDSKNAVSYSDLLNCLVNALNVTQDLLKRPDEAEVVLKSHFRPQFAEDAVRNVAATFAELYGHRLEQDAKIRIESLSLESIHSHDVICRLNTTAGKLKEILEP